MRRKGTQAERDDELEFDQAREMIQKRRVRPRQAKELSQLVGRVVTSRGIAAQLSTRQIDQAWQLLTEQRWPQRTRVGELSRGVLEILVRDSITNQELTFEKKQMLLQLQQQLPDAKIKNLVFRIGY